MFLLLSFFTFIMPHVHDVQDDVDACAMAMPRASDAYA